MNEGFHAIGFVSLSDIPFTPAVETLPVVPMLVRGDPPASIATLVEWDAYDPDAVAVVRRRIADRGLIYPDNTFYESRLMNRVTVSQSGFDSIGVGGRVALTLSLINLFNDDREFDAMVAEGLALGRNFVVKTMPAPDQTASDCGGGDLSNASTVFTGVVAATANSRDNMQLSGSDLGERLNTPLQSSLYDGLGGLGGTIDLTGKPKPVTVGFVFNAEPQYVGLVDFGNGMLPTYQSNWRTILGHTVVRERGVVMTKVTHLPGIGQWRDWPAFGCFQIGFTANGIITCDLRGDAGGTGYAGRTSLVIQRILTALGPQLATSDLDAASFALLDLRLTGEIGWRQGAEVISAVEAVDQILAHSGVWLAGGRDGKLRVSVLDARH